MEKEEGEVYVSRRHRRLSKGALSVEQRLAQVERPDVETKSDGGSSYGDHAEKVLMSVEELAGILERSSDDPVMRRKTEQLVQLVSSEINRILQYDESEATPQQLSSFESSASATESLPGISTRDPSISSEDVDAIMAHISRREQEREGSGAQEGANMDEFDPDELESLLSFMSGEEKEIQLTDKSPGSLTPYEIWKHQRVRHQEERQGKQLTEEEWSRVVERLNAYQKQKEEAVLRAQFKVLGEELKALKFQPNINAKSRKMAQVIRPLQERQVAILEKRRERIKQEKERLAHEEAASCPHTPQINKTKRWKGKVSKKYLSASKELFKEDEAELTFSPKVNKKSARIVQQAERKGARISVTDPTRKSSKGPAHAEQPTFSPQINARSRLVHRPEENIFERLYKTMPERMQDAARTKSAEESFPRRGSSVVSFDADKHAFLLNLKKKKD